MRFPAMILLTLLAIDTAALPDDRSQAIEISATKAIRDEKAGFTVYSGDVVMEQGSLYIEADKLTVFHDRKAADRIVAVGEPARLRQQPEIDKPFVTASAGRIEYLKSAERVLLRDSATIEQDGAVVSGDSIDYLMAEQRVRADAREDDQNARVQVTIPAEVVVAETGDGDSEAPDDAIPPAGEEATGSAKDPADPNAGPPTGSNGAATDAATPAKSDSGAEQDAGTAGTGKVSNGDAERA
jgi:lipopolysaccharide export system protein LptA